MLSSGTIYTEITSPVVGKVLDSRMPGTGLGRNMGTVQVISQWTKDSLRVWRDAEPSRHTY